MLKIMDVQSQPDDLKAYADRLEVLCRAQADEITRLRAELARATEGATALATLQALYRSPDLPQSLRAKCAIGCLVHETPALKPVQQLELVAEPAPEPLSVIVEKQRARMIQMHQESPEFRRLASRQVIELKPNGDDSNDD